MIPQLDFQQGAFLISERLRVVQVKILGRDNCIAQTLDVTDMMAVQTAVSRYVSFERR